MSKFEKLTGGIEMNDDLLDNVNGGAIIPDIENQSLDNLINMYEQFKSSYHNYINLGWDKSTNSMLKWQYDDCVDSLTRIEKEFDAKGYTGYSRD